jgi:hypothetical protein
MKMNFEKAHKELLAGKKIRRKEWEPYMHLRLISDAIKTFRGENISFYGNANLLLSKDWLVVDGDGKKLTFLEALEELKQKKAITRDEGLDSFIFVDNGNLAMCRQVEYEFMPTFKCLCSTDWEVMK